MRYLWKIVVGLFAIATGLGCEGVAVAAYVRSTDVWAIRFGMAGDFFNLAIIAGGLGLVFLGLAVWLLWPRKAKQPDLISQF
ncbi:putative membrane protein [Asticcacaulis biprosthecium C19]|uniref:Putative membrane protein n=1 Tax=Asticcacaulis biprosthecium C19 TaxID=715226 RepID=F4QRY2_9CAUL|nr:hypothetical protein [Asticcacaulis biprosthecium]EGF89502.1 putative membrane protein [Asticcacaulis biprosthecium C19]